MTSLWETQHEAVSNLARAWEMTAESLLHASRVLRERVDKAASALSKPPNEDIYLTPVELMLRGMAIECLFKAIWVHKGHKLSEAGKSKPIPGAAGHDLVKLAAAVGVALDTNQSDLSMRLSHFTEYPGRYPMPMQASKLQLQPSPSGGHASPTHWSAKSDDPAFDQLIAHLKKCLS